MMKPIINEKGAVVAYEHQRSTTRNELLSKSGGLLAWHDRNTDQTFDRRGKRSGFGDQTKKFIPREG